MNKCELCKSPAQTYCESDQAILCWDCDAKVHGANFLVSRHSRTLLCNHCKIPTPWKASGPRLGHTVSVCDGCAGGGSAGPEDETRRPDDDPETEEDEEDDADEYEEEEEDRDVHDEEEEGENQVVPGSSTPPPPSASYSSSDDDFSETVTLFSKKRMRENSPDLDDRDREGNFADSVKPVKNQRQRRRDCHDSSGQSVRLMWLKHLWP